MLPWLSQLIATVKRHHTTQIVRSQAVWWSNRLKAEDLDTVALSGDQQSQCIGSNHIYSQTL